MQLKVIYIDDEVGMCQMFEDNFASPTVAIQAYTGPQQGLEALRRDGADLLIVDFHLAGMTADELLALLPADLPIALITGELSLKPGPRFIRVFHKPLDFEAMTAFLNSCPPRKRMA